MGAPPNELYTAFSFIGFVLCAIPFYWHLEAWNTGTCMYMAWTGLGCLLQFVNSIVWNKNVIDKAPVYCDIATRIQVGLNVAIPACSLCINRRLYKIATVKAVMITPAEKRRAVITDLLIGIGIPILQMAVQYVVEGHRYNIFEDFGPLHATVIMIPSFPLFYAWPVAIGVISLVYCIMTIYQFYKRGRQFKQIMSSNRGLNQSRYLRLMALSLVEILGTIPLGSWVIAHQSKLFMSKWLSWEDTHSNYSRVVQVPSVLWKADHEIVVGLETFRWSLPVCAFIFFGFFGFADEARKHYRLVYTSLASRIGYSTSSGSFTGSSHATSSFPHMKSKGGISVSVVTTSRNKRDSTFSFSDQLSIPSISIASDLKPDFKVEQYSPSESTASASVSSFNDEIQGQTPLQTTTAVTPPSLSVPPHLPDTPKSIIRPTSAYSTDASNSV